MKQLVLAGLFYAAMCLGVAQAEAGHWQDAGSKVWGWTTGLVVTTDKVLHWTWGTFHDKLLHPLTEALLLGTVDFDPPVS
mgnify:CR=1 FL=1